MPEDHGPCLQAMVPSSYFVPPLAVPCVCV